MTGYEAEYALSMQLRYSYRLDPLPGQRIAFGKAFGCARVVFNDGLQAREEAHNAGLPYIADSELSACLTAAKRTRLAKSVNDAGWSSFVAMLEYKARLYGRSFTKIGRFEPTSQTCCLCGLKDGPKPLCVRVWQCWGCGVWLDRDINAAVNVAKAAGLAVTAWGAQVRPEAPPLAQRGEAGTLPKPRREVA
jgi:transposase